MKNNKLVSLILALLVCFLLVMTVSATTDNQNLAIAVEANPSTVVYGDTIKVSVMINENPGNLGVNFDVKWDTNVLTCVKAETTDSAFEAVKTVQKDNRVVVTIGDPSLGVQYPNLATKITGTGKILELTFAVKDGADADADTVVYIERASYADLNGKAVENIAITNLNVKVLSSSHVHTPGAEPTCTTNQICTACGMELKPALGHNMVVDAKKNPTCTETGLTEGSHCTRCDGATVAQQVVPALGHNIVKDAKKDPTCTATGLTQGSHCTRCNGATVAQQKVPALGHNIVTDAKKDPTCTETGLTEGSHCSVCNTVIVAQTTVEALGHTYGEWTVTTEPTETEVGVESRTCSVCNDTETREIPATGVTTTPPTNTTDDPVVSTGDGEGDGESKGFPWVIVVVVVVVLLILLLLLLLLKKKKKKA